MCEGGGDLYKTRFMWDATFLVIRAFYLTVAAAWNAQLYWKQLYTLKACLHISFPAAGTKHTVLNIQMHGFCTVGTHSLMSYINGSEVLWGLFAHSWWAHTWLLSSRSKWCVANLWLHYCSKCLMRKIIKTHDVMTTSFTETLIKAKAGIYKKMDEVNFHFHETSPTLLISTELDWLLETLNNILEALFNLFQL